MIHGPLHSSASRERFEGFLAVLTEAGAAPAQSHIVPGGLSIEGGYAAAATLLKNGPPTRHLLCE